MLVTLEPPSDAIHLEGEVRHVETAQDDRWCYHAGVQFQNLDGPREALLDRVLDHARRGRQ